MRGEAADPSDTAILIVSRNHDDGKVKAPAAVGASGRRGGRVCVVPRNPLATVNIESDDGGSPTVPDRTVIGAHETS